MLPFFKSSARYKVAYGGRGGGKSWAFSDFAVLEAYQQKLFFPCVRQFQISIRDSVHKLLSDSIEKFNLKSFFEITDNSIRGKNGSEFIFKGVARNINNIKSLEGADRLWFTEAVDATDEALKKLIPTIRKPGSQMWFDFNPEEETDPVYKFSVVQPPDNSMIVKINWTDNPFFTPELEAARQYDLKYNPDEYPWIWEGECKKVSEAQIMRGKWEVLEFDTPDDAIFYYGSDWGNTGLGDPDVIVRFFVEDGFLYIDEEVKAHIQNIEEYPAFYAGMPGADRWKIKCDSSMPKFRRYLNGRGFNLVDAAKGPGSVEAGIKFLRSFKRIYIHPRCKGTIFEFKNYKYKVDPKTSEILPVIVDKHNHFIDSLRYAAEDLMFGSNFKTIR